MIAMALLSFVANGYVIFIAIIVCSMVMNGEAKSVVVGGSDGWRFGVNYTDWAIQNSPFFINDKLVFKYEAPSESTYEYSVYMLPNLGSFAACDFSDAQLLANSTQGTGNGFEVKLSQWRPYYFASFGDDGFHCNDGLMRLMAVPWTHFA